MSRAVILVLILFAGLAAGCRQASPDIFPAPSPPVVWPPAPALPRIRYVGQLRSAADLKPPPKLFQALGDLLVGPAKPQELYGPRAVLCTPDGERVWIADPGGRCLHLFDLNRRAYQKIERAGAAHFLSPVGLGLGPENSIYVCDSESVAIWRLSAETGVLLETLRLPEDIARPVALRYEDATGELYVVDSGAHDLKVLARDGTLRRIIGSRGRAPGELNFPCDLIGRAGVLWVVDAGNARVQGMTPAGEPIVSIGQAGDAPGDLALPKGVALDSEGHVYVVDARFENVQIFDQTGQLLLGFGEEGTDPGEFWLPGGICIDRNDRIWICDTYNRRVQVFDYVRQSDEASAAGTPGAPAQ